MTVDKLDYLLAISTATRNNIKKIAGGLSIEQLNAIPQGFNNNIVWNYMHIVATQQLLCYSLSGLKPRLDTDLVNAYRKGTAPGDFVSQEDLQEWYELGQTSIEMLRKDYLDGLFKEYKTYTTSYNMSLSSIDDALQFNVVHEGLHLGTVLALRKLV